MRILNNIYIYIYRVIHGRNLSSSVQFDLSQLSGVAMSLFHYNTIDRNWDSICTALKEDKQVQNVIATVQISK